MTITEYKVGLISAPPGYGKSTLAAQFARQFPSHVGWHTLEERDRDPTTLYHHTITALEPSNTNIRRELPEPGNRSSAELVNLVADYLHQDTSQHRLLVFDDYHLLSGHRSSEGWFQSLIERLPPSTHILLISRIQPRLPMIHLLGYQQIFAIRQADLRLTADEIRGIATTLGNSNLAESNFRYLDEYLEGWPVGVMLALQLPELAPHSKKPADRLFESLAERLLNSQPPAITEFLLASSTLNWITPENCRDVLGIKGGQQRLKEIEARNLFLMRAQRGYSYHQLFKSFLQTQLRKAAPQRYRELHAAAAHWHEVRDEGEEAFDHYLEADQNFQAAALAEHFSTTFFNQGRFETLLNWNARLANAEVDTPTLWFDCATIHSDRLDYATAIPQLQRADAAYQQQGAPDAVYKVRSHLAHIHLEQNHYHEAISLATDALQTGDVEVRGRALRVMGLAHFRSGSSEQGLAYMEEGRHLLKAAGASSTLSHLLQDMEFAYSRLGQLDKAGTCLHEYIALRRQLGGQYALALGLNNLGYYYHIRSDYQRARQTFEEGLQMAAASSNPRAEGVLLWSFADLERDLTNYENARSLYEQSLGLLLVGDALSLRSQVLISMSIMQQRAGHLAEAATTIEKACELLAERPQSLEAVLAVIIQQTIHYLSGDHSALGELDDGLKLLRALEARTQLAGLLGLCAGLYHREGDKGTARQYLQDAFDMSARIGSTQPLAVEMAEYPALAALMNDDQSQQIHDDLAVLIRARKHYSAERSPASVEMLEPGFSLEIQLLGQDFVLRDGTPIPSSDWRSTKARELFYILVLEGPKSRDEVGLVFWPDATRVQVRDNFHTTLKRARRALGGEVILFDEELSVYRIDPNVKLSCDVLQMEQFVDEARMLPVNDARTTELWNRIINLYQGELLIDLGPPDWAALRSQQIERLYMDALVGSGDAAHARADYHTAMESYQQVLMLDPYREDIHRAIMKCYRALNYISRVIEHYQQLETLLASDINAPPAPETTRLYHELIR